MRGKAGLRRVLATLPFAAILVALPLAALASPAPGAASEGSSRVAQAATPTPTSRPSGCTVHADKVAGPSIVGLGGTVGVTLTVRATCTYQPPPIHIVLVVEATDAMQGDTFRETRAGLEELVRRLNLKNNPAVRVAVLRFNTRSVRLCGLTNDEARVQSCIRRAQGSGNADVAAGLRGGQKEMIAGRRLTQEDPYSINEVLILVAKDVADEQQCRSALSQARNLKSQGILLITVCADDRCRPRCLLEMASSPRYVFTLENIDHVYHVLDRIRRDLFNFTLRQIIVHDVLAPDMEFETGSDLPPAVTPIAPGELKWVQNYIPRDGVTLTYVLRPTRLGRQPTSLEASVVWTDNQNRGSRTLFPTTEVEVRVPTPTATATPTVTPSPTRTAVPTRRPTATPTEPAEIPRYLPALLRNAEPVTRP